MATILYDTFTGSGSLGGHTPEVGGPWTNNYGSSAITAITLVGGSAKRNGSGSSYQAKAGGVFGVAEGYLTVKATLPVAPANGWGFDIMIDVPGTSPTPEATGFSIIYNTAAAAYRYYLYSKGASSGYLTHALLTPAQHSFDATFNSDGVTILIDGAPLATLAPYSGFITSLANKSTNISLQIYGAIESISASTGARPPTFPPSFWQTLAGTSEIP